MLKIAKITTRFESSLLASAQVAMLIFAKKQPRLAEVHAALFRMELRT